MPLKQVQSMSIGEIKNVSKMGLGVLLTRQHVGWCPQISHVAGDMLLWLHAPLWQTFKSVVSRLVETYWLRTAAIHYNTICG